ncbi:hypothetical protein BHE74_00003292 [Ensete ventricosum]|nr:hypothetical protein GW17_00010512 [Ensete ventricosum]RWW87873.1 hypothetical protein BHE74_00003292 [Ensete ventricosum]RZR80653.1 hypothetical protein BHM03_00006708 [Ensete ventricosum]
MGITIWAVTFAAVKKTVSRLLLLVVSMGYGVVRPTLGGITSRVALLGLVYFIASEALELVEHLGNINDFSGKARLFLVLPVALLDATFIIKKSTAKLELYRKFTNSLAVSVLLSVAWIGYELYFNATDPLSELWQRYAYSEDTNEDFDDEGIPLTGSGVRGIGDNLSKLERKERKNMDHVFGMGDDLEEDKRE